jgi:hypothetical protein
MSQSVLDFCVLFATYNNHIYYYIVIFVITMLLCQSIILFSYFPCDCTVNLIFFVHCKY